MHSSFDCATTTPPPSSIAPHPPLPLPLMGTFFSGKCMGISLTKAIFPSHMHPYIYICTKPNPYSLSAPNCFPVISQQQQQHTTTTTYNNSKNTPTFHLQNESAKLFKLSFMSLSSFHQRTAKKA